MMTRVRRSAASSAWCWSGWSLLAAVLGGIYWFKHRAPGPGNGDLIAAQEGDYKVKPDDPGGMKVAGEGDAAVAASGGAAGGNGSIAVSNLPEAPITGTQSCARREEAAPAHRPRPRAYPVRAAS